MNNRNKNKKYNLKDENVLSNKNFQEVKFALEHELKHVPINFSNNNKSNEDLSKISFELMNIDNRLCSYENYLIFLYILIGCSSICLISSFYYLIIVKSEREDSTLNYKAYDVFNFIMNSVSLIAYTYGAQGFNSQNYIRNINFKYMVIALVAINLIYVILFLYFPVTFFIWCSNTFFFILNIVIFVKLGELINLLKIKDNLKERF